MKQQGLIAALILTGYLGVTTVALAQTATPPSKCNPKVEAAVNAYARGAELGKVAVAREAFSPPSSVAGLTCLDRQLAAFAGSADGVFTRNISPNAPLLDKEISGENYSDDRNIKKDLATRLNDSFTKQNQDYLKNFANSSAAQFGAYTGNALNKLANESGIGQILGKVVETQNEIMKTGTNILSWMSKIRTLVNKTSPFLSPELVIPVLMTVRATEMLIKPALTMLNQTMNTVMGQALRQAQDYIEGQAKQETCKVMAQMTNGGENEYKPGDPKPFMLGVEGVPASMTSADICSGAPDGAGAGVKDTLGSPENLATRNDFCKALKELDERKFSAKVPPCLVDSVDDLFDMSTNCRGPVSGL